MYCPYVRLPDFRLRCPQCGDETTRIWLSGPETWPRRTCHVRVGGKRVPIYGVGDYQAMLIHALGVQQKPGCGCHGTIRDMNAWGIEGCLLNRKTIIKRLRKNYQTLSWSEMVHAAKKLPYSLALKAALRFDPAAALFEEAIRLKSTATDFSSLQPTRQV